VDLFDEGFHRVGEILGAAGGFGEEGAAVIEKFFETERIGVGEGGFGGDSEEGERVFLGSRSENLTVVSFTSVLYGARASLASLGQAPGPGSALPA
jgi:hypothetical protein